MLSQHTIVGRDSEIAPTEKACLVGRDSEIAPTEKACLVGGNSDSRLLPMPTM